MGTKLNKKLNIGEDMRLHIGELNIDYYSDSHSESVKKLNKDKTAKLDINFYIEGGSDEKDHEKFLRYKEICDGAFPTELITSKGNYNWIFEGTRLVEFTHRKKMSKFFEGEIIETSLTFDFDCCWGSNDFAAVQRHLQLKKIGL